MLLNGRDLIKQAAEDINATKVLPFKIEVTDIENAQGDDLKNIINYFLDSIETISETKEHLIPQNVISLYNNIVDKSVNFDVIENGVDVFDIDSIVFRRTKFNE